MSKVGQNQQDLYHTSISGSVSTITRRFASTIARNSMSDQSSRMFPIALSTRVREPHGYIVTTTEWSPS
jgi:hypothetical protein